MDAAAIACGDDGLSCLDEVVVVVAAAVVVAAVAAVAAACARCWDCVRSGDDDDSWMNRGCCSPFTTYISYLRVRMRLFVVSVRVCVLVLS